MFICYLNLNRVYRQRSNEYNLTVHSTNTYMREHIEVLKLFTLSKITNNTSFIEHKA